MTLLIPFSSSLALSSLKHTLLSVNAVHPQQGREHGRCEDSVDLPPLQAAPPQKLGGRPRDPGQEMYGNWAAGQELRGRWNAFGARARAHAGPTRHWEQQAGDGTGFQALFYCGFCNRSRCPSP